jgi:hypothetical protein
MIPGLWNSIDFLLQKTSDYLYADYPCLTFFTQTETYFN